MRPPLRRLFLCEDAPSNGSAHALGLPEFARCEEDPEYGELEAATERLRVKERDLQSHEARDLEDAPGCK